MSRRSVVHALAALYVWIGIVTFGHAWNAVKPLHTDDESLQAMHALGGAAACAFVWPLYWSVQGWARK